MADSLRFDLIARDLATANIARVGAAASRLGSGLGKASTQFFGLGGAATLGAASIVQAGAAVGAFAAQLSGLAVIAPAALGAVALGAGTVKLGLSGVSDAFTKLTPKPKTLEEAMARLAPAARAFVEAVQQVRPAFDALKLDVQQRLFAGLAGQVTGLAGTYLPILRGELGKVAESFNRAALGVGAFFRSQGATRDVSVALANMRVSLSAASGALVPFSRALLDIVTVGSGYLPALGRGIDRAAESFARFVSSARGKGQIDDFIQGGIRALHQLGVLAASVGGILAGIFRAAGAGNVNPFGTVLDGIDKFVNSPAGQGALTAVFAAANAVVTALLPILGQLATILLSSVAPALGQLVVAAAPGLVVFFQALATAAQILADSGALEAVGRAIGAVAVALAPVLPELALALADALIKMAPYAGPLASAFADLALALIPLLPPLTELATKIVGILIPGVRDLATMVRNLTPAFTTVARDVGDFAGSADRALGDFQRGVQSAGDYTHRWFVTSGESFGRIGAAIGQFSIDANRRMTDWARTTGDSIGQIGRFFYELPGTINRALAGAGSWLVQIGANLVQGFWNGAVDRWNGMIRWLNDRANDVIGLFRRIFGIHSPSTVMAEIGSNVIAGLPVGMDREMPNVIASARRITDGVADAVTADMGRARIGLDGQFSSAVTSAATVSVVASATGSDTAAAVHAGVLAALDGARMVIDGNGVARLVNNANLANGVRRS